MNPTVKDRVDKFRWNLNLLIEDRHLTQQKISTRLFFDCHDYTALILGMYFFYKPEGVFDTRNFNNESTLVHCLASANWLGKIQLLPPHRAEFMNLMNRDFGLTPKIKNPKHIAQEFLQNIGIEIELYESLEKLKEFDDDQKVEYLKAKAGSARHWFKALQCIRGSWRNRLINWIENSPPWMESEKFNLKEIIAREEYSKLKEAFDDHRRHLTYNNFSDAVALTLLITHLEDFTKGNSKWLPLLYDPGRTFRRVAKKAGLKRRFKYTSEQGHKFSILRDSQYFVLRATLTSDFIPETNISLEQLQEYISEIEKVQGPLADATVDKIDDIKIGGNSLLEIIDSLEKLTFFESIWFPYSSEDLKGVVEELEKAAKQFEDPAWRDEVNKAIKRINSNLKKSVVIYSDFHALWGNMIKPISQLQALNKKLKAHGKVVMEHDIFDFQLHFALIRFSFPDAVNDRINKVLVQFADGSSENESLAQVETFSALNDLATMTIEESAKSLMFIAGLLWCLKLDEEIVKRLETRLGLWVRNWQDFYPLNIIYIASLLRECERSKKLSPEKIIQRAKAIQSRLNDFETSFNKRRKMVDSRDVEVGMAYLYFHLFLLIRHHLPTKVETESALPNYNRFRKRAIDLAKNAWVNSESMDAKAVYALNQYLYYMVEGLPDWYKDCEEWEIQDAAENLLKYRNLPAFWQSRFDDTLARHFERLAWLAQDEDDWKRKTKMAEIHLDQALETSHNDQEVLQYASTFENRNIGGFHRRDSGLAKECRPDSLNSNE